MLASYKVIIHWYIAIKIIEGHNNTEMGSYPDTNLKCLTSSHLSKAGVFTMQFVISGGISSEYKSGSPSQ
jgi:FAD synthase